MGSKGAKYYVLKKLLTAETSSSDECRNGNIGPSTRYMRLIINTLHR